MLASRLGQFQYKPILQTEPEWRREAEDPQW